jgi:hypothetical protein
MKHSFSILWLVLGTLLSGVVQTNAQVNVTQHHNHDSRHGLYVDPAFVGVLINNPASVTAWATSAIGGAIWGVGGIASDGTNPFVSTGNTFNTGGNWGGGEAVIRFRPGPIFTGRDTYSYPDTHGCA